MRISVLTCCCLLLLATVGSADKDSKPKSLLDNGSFEAVVPPKTPTESGRGQWTYGPDKRVPSGWSLNSGYPGKITVLEEGSAEGKRCIQILSDSKRDAQMYRPCPGIRPGRWYRITARVRDGAASVLAYEYRTDGSVKAHTLTTGSGPKGTWRQITGFYSPIENDFESASVALLVPRGTAAVLDDVVVEELKGAPGASTRSVRLANKEVELVISGLGRLESLITRADKVDHADRSAPTSVMSAVRDGVRVPLASLTKSGSTLTARFADPALAAKVRIKARDRYFLFEVTEATKAIDTLEFRFPVKALRVRDTWMPGTYDDSFGICHMAVTANTQTRLGYYGASVAPEARWYRHHGIKGGRSVLIATSADRLLDSIRRMELDTGLPSPMLRSGAPGQTGTTDWARLSPSLKQSYFFATYLAPGHVEDLIRYAKLGGFGMIMLHRISWRASAGHETIARKAFPEGLPDLVKACEQIHAAGLRVGLHLFGPLVSLNDAYVTPVPDPRLFTLELAPLAAGVDASATELTLKRQPKLPRRASASLYPGDLLRIGDEIVRWKELVPGTPCRLTGCERGALGTAASAHRVGAEVRSFAMRNGRLLVDPDSTLPEEMGDHLARVVNATRVDLVYFDAIGAAPEGQQPDRWYYVNRTLLASCAKFDHGVLVQTGMGPGRQLPWHLVPRSASADGHGDLKGYLDQRLPGILQMRRTFTAADIGWYALDVHGRPDELEYVCAKALATDASVSVQAHKPLLESHPRAREVFEMISRWERRRITDDVPPAMRQRLLTKKRDFRLLEEGEQWSLWEAEYEADRPILALDGQANRWTVRNAATEPVRLALEIQREAIATTPAQHASGDAIPLVDLADLSAFDNRDDPQLVAYAQIGERKIRAEGGSLRGVNTSLRPATNVPGGTSGLLFSADNTTNGAGWCTTGTRLDPPLDLSISKALGLWVHGDGHGHTLGLLLCDAGGRRARLNVTVDFKGWRFRSFPLRASFDWSRIEYLILEFSHIAPRAKVSTGVAAIRAVKMLHEPRAIQGLTITLGDRTVRLPVALEPNRCLTVDALGRAIFWPGGMHAGRPVDLEGGPLILPPGSHPIEIAVEPADGYAGDVSVRVCRTWPLDE